MCPLFRGSTVYTQVHGRSREQRYTKLADWDYISQCAQAAAPMPVFGCGDILSYEDYDLHRQQQQSIAGIMIARYEGIFTLSKIFKEVLHFPEGGHFMCKFDRYVYIQCIYIQVKRQTDSI